MVIERSDSLAQLELRQFRSGCWTTQVDPAICRPVAEHIAHAGRAFPLLPSSKGLRASSGALNEGWR